MHPGIQELLADQSGVVARRQLFAAGLRPHDVARLVRRRELVRVHPGVYLDHTGQPTWQQLAWASVLATWPSALTHGSALRAAEGPGSLRKSSPIHVAVDRDRNLREPAGVRLHHSGHLEERVQWHLGPPRVRYEEAALDVAAEAASDFLALGEVARAVQSSRTTGQRLLIALAGRERIARRAWLESVLSDVVEGTCSVLEHGYLTRVERAHGLVRARRQVRDRVGAGTIYRDVEYSVGLVVELDGRLFHDTAAQRDRDMDRDLATAVDGKDSVRLGYGQVFDRPCWTAGHVRTLLRMRGWRGLGRSCGPTCTW